MDSWFSMKILLITNYFPPEIGAASHLFWDLATGLISKGHEVSVLSGFPRYNVKKEVYLNYKNRNKKVIVEKKNGIDIIRVYMPFFETQSLLAKGVEHLFLPYFFSKGINSIGKLDAIITCSPPVSLVFVGYFLKKKYNAKLIMGIQDIFPQNAIDIKALKDPLSITFFRLQEKLAYKLSDHITVHSEGNADYLIKKAHLPPSKVSVIYNWVDTDFIRPLPKINKFSQQYGLTDKFVVSFAGTMGISQDMEIILKAADELRDKKDIVFLLIGDGLKRKWVEDFVKEKKLQNVLLLPMQPKEIYPWILASSNIGLVTLKKDVKTPVVPSKILSIMASGRPIVAALPKDGDAPKLIKKAGAGLVVDAGDCEDFAQAILTIYKSESLEKQFGAQGRNFAENELSKEVGVLRFEKLLIKLIRNEKKED